MALPPPSPSATALVTGASSGIGAAIARELASRGHALTLAARRQERLQSLASELTADHGVEARTIAADLSDAAGRAGLVREIDEGGRTVEVLVNNAGYGSRGDFASSDLARQLAMVRVNVDAVVELTGTYTPGMVRRGRGAVLNVGSTAAFQPMPSAATYAASKAFVLAFSEALSAEVSDHGVTVTVLCPGPVRTEFAEVAGLGAIEERTPGVIWASAEEVAREAVEGVERDRRVVVPGALNRAGAIAGQHVPRALALPLVKRFWPQV